MPLLKKKKKSYIFFPSSFINFYSIRNFHSTNRTFSNIFSTFNTHSIMPARYKNNIPFIFATNNTKLAHTRNSSININYTLFIFLFNFTIIRTSGPYFKRSIIIKYMQFALNWFLRKPKPWPICGSIVF